MLGLAVGIDYALFILSRHRQNLDDGLKPREAAAQATATAGSAVVFAGATVVIALVGLAVVNIPFLTVMGVAAAATVSLAVLIAVTLLPAHARIRRASASHVSTGCSRSGLVAVRRGPDARALRYVEAHHSPATGRGADEGLVLLGTIALPATHMKLGLPDDGASPTSSTERRAYDLLDGGLRSRLQRAADRSGLRTRGPA